jgi:hypothetical protein
MLSIIVTHYKSPMLKLCLESAMKAAKDLDHEILVVDCEAQEDTRELVNSNFPEIKYFAFKENVGYAKLDNHGTENSKGEFVLVLNWDMVLTEDSIGRMIDFMKENPRIGMLGPRLVGFNGLTQDSCFRFYRLKTIVYRRTWLGKTKWGKKELDRFLMKDLDRRESRQVDWLQGAAMMIRRDALRDVGPMDERFFLFFEDVDWCRRFHENNWQVVYFPEAIMYHCHGQVSKKKGISDLLFNKYAWIHIFSAIKYFWKYRKN